MYYLVLVGLSTKIWWISRFLSRLVNIWTRIWMSRTWVLAR